MNIFTLSCSPSDCNSLYPQCFSCHSSEELVLSEGRELVSRCPDRSSTDFLLWKNTWPLPLARQSLVLAGAAVAKVWPGDLFFKGKGLWSHNYCQHNIKSWFVTFAFSQVYRGCMTCDITTEQLWERPWSSINPDSKAVCKKYKQCHSSQIFLF